MIKKKVGIMTCEEWRGVQYNVYVRAASFPLHPDFICFWVPREGGMIHWW